MNDKWDAVKYTNDFSFVHKYGNDLLQLIDIKKDMSVLDLGCGNGTLTKKMSDMGLNAIGLDSSEDLLEIAHELHTKNRAAGSNHSSRRPILTPSSDNAWNKTPYT